ncbi:MAG: hypothetical protein WC821_00980 [archaeon]|jgi:hypothetical protein
MDFKLDFGPWETIFSGTTYGHEVEIVSNPEHFYLVLIFDKRDEKRVGAVIEGYKAYYAKGAMESFIQTLPKPSFGVEKTIGDRTGKIFFLSFDPFYVDFKQEDFSRKIDIAIKRVDENAITIVDLARASSLELKDLSTVAKNDYAPILGDPFTIKSLISGQKPNDLSKIDLSQVNINPESTGPMIQLGLSKAREIIREPIESFKRTQIVGQGTALQYSLYILTENLLLENIPVIVFDSIDCFDGLSIATNDSASLKDELVDFEPLGFPLRQFNAKDTIKISLKDTDLIFVLEQIGLDDLEFQKNLSLFSFTARVNTPDELIQKVFETKDLGDYEKLRAERMLRIIEKSFKGIFGPELPPYELTKPVPGKLGRALVIDTRNLNKEEKVLFMHTIIRQLTKSVVQTQPTNCMLILPEADLLFEQNSEKATTALSRLENRGIGVIIATEKELPEELSKSISAKINIVSGKDIAVWVKGKRSYRVNLRPSLSGSPRT